MQGSSSSTNQGMLQPAFLIPLSNPFLLDSQTPYVSQLLPYFNERVARRLAWVDGPENPWRHMVLPLINSSETVLSSVLALTAHDLASQYPPNDPWSKKFRATSQTYQDKALSLLARELSTLHGSASRIGSDASTTLILGSVIILCNNELLTAQTAGWRVHLQAAREVIRAEADRLQLQQNTNRIQEFFLQEFYATSVWAQLTTFHEMDDMIVQSPLVSSRDAVFTDFLRIIHQITLAERVKARSQLLQISQEKKIPFVVYLHPEVGEVMAHEYKEGGRLIMEWAEKHHVKLVNGLDEGVTADMYRDVIHLNEKGQRNLANSLERIFNVKSKTR